MGKLNEGVQRLLSDLFMIAAMQHDLDERGLTLGIEWKALKERIGNTMLDNGLELPSVPEFGAATPLPDDALRPAGR